MSIYDEFELMRDELYTAEWNRYEGHIQKVVDKVNAIMDNYPIYEPSIQITQIPETKWYVILCAGMIENIIFTEQIIIFDNTEEN